MTCRISLLALCLGCIPLLPAQTLFHTDSAQQWASTITSEDLSELLYILAADSMEGRETAKPGQRKAASFLASQFEELGLQPVNGSYFQTVPLTVTQLKGGLLTLGTEKLVFKDDFVPYPGIEVADIVAEAVFVGYGIQDGLWDDYAGLDVSGKTVVMMSGEPGSAEKGFELTGTDSPSKWSQDPSAKRMLADSLGAVATVLVTPEFATLKSRLVPWLSRERMRLDVEREGEGTDLPTLLVSEDVLLRSTGWKSMKDVRKKWPKRKLKGTDLGAMELHLARKADKVEATNVWGLLPGSDSLLASEIVACCTGDRLTYPVASALF